MMRKWLAFCLVTVLMLSINAYGGICYSAPPWRCFSPRTTSIWFAKGEVLWWQAREDGLQFLRHVPYVPGMLPLHEKTAYLDYNWNTGFRLGFGCRYPCSRFYTSLTWTHFRNKVSGHTTNIDSSAFAFITAPFPGVTGLNVSTFDSEERWKLNYNVVDWEIGIPLTVNRCFAMTPFLSLRGGVINQNLDNDLNFTQIATPGIANIDIRNAQNDFKCIGLRAGFDIQAGLVCGFSIYGKGAGSLVYGKFDIQDNIVELTQNISNGSIISEEFFDFPKRDFRVRTNLEIAFGLQWSATLCNHTQRITLKLGYEFVYWYQQNLLRNRLQHFSRPPNLGIQGIQLIARYDF